MVFYLLFLFTALVCFAQYSLVKEDMNDRISMRHVVTLFFPFTIAVVFVTKSKISVSYFIFSAYEFEDTF